MPFKKAKTLSCWDCGESKREGEMASWGDKGWRCNACYNAELSFLKETRKTEVAMRKAANDYYHGKGNGIRDFAKNYRLWNWGIFWDYVEEVRKEDSLLRIPTPPPIEEEEYTPWEEEEAITYLESLPPLEKVKWSDYTEDDPFPGTIELLSTGERVY